MKYFLVLIVAMMGLQCTSWGQVSDCAKFKHGKFNHVENGQILGSITRKGDKQIERYGDVKIVCTVKWISDCEYELRHHSSNKAWEAETNPATEKMVIKVNMTRVEEDGYWLRATIVGKKSDMSELHFVLVR